MLRPSYSDLMESINTSELVNQEIKSRYTIVLAAAKRARQLIDGANPLTYAPTDRAVSIAIKEMDEGKLSLRMQDGWKDRHYDRMLESQNRYRNIGIITTKEETANDYDIKYEEDEMVEDEYFGEEPEIDDDFDLVLDEFDE